MRPKVLGRCKATGLRVLAPASREGVVSVARVQEAIGTIRANSSTLSADLARVFKDNVKAARAWQYDEWPGMYYGMGSTHDLDAAPLHRFWHLRSTSKAAALAYSAPKHRPIGFHKPR